MRQFACLFGLEVCLNRNETCDPDWVAAALVCPPGGCVRVLAVSHQRESGRVLQQAGSAQAECEPHAAGMHVQNASQAGLACLCEGRSGTLWLKPGAAAQGERAVGMRHAWRALRACWSRRRRFTRLLGMLFTRDALDAFPGLLAAAMAGACGACRHQLRVPTTQRRRPGCCGLAAAGAAGRAGAAWVGISRAAQGPRPTSRACLQPTTPCFAPAGATAICGWLQPLQTWMLLHCVL